VEADVGLGVRADIGCSVGADARGGVCANRQYWDGTWRCKVLRKTT
jgi:hypothetical protein